MSKFTTGVAYTASAGSVLHGYSEDEPLLRSGELRDSIESEVVALAAIVGTKSEIGFWQELGTSHIPPRPFIGPAYVRKIDPLMEAIEKALSSGFKVYLRP